MSYVISYPLFSFFYHTFSPLSLSSSPSLLLSFSFLPLFLLFFLSSFPPFSPLSSLPLFFFFFLSSLSF
ncbi:hypothetical protein ACXWRW_11880, partial [Streptococcus pyogenes]